MTNATARFDRSAIFRDAWGLARKAASAAGEAVRAYIGNALRAAWQFARADRAAAAKPKSPVQVLREQIAINDRLVADTQASIDSAWSIFGSQSDTTYERLDRLHADGVALREDLAELERPAMVPQPVQQQQAQAAGSRMSLWWVGTYGEDNWECVSGLTGQDAIKRRALQEEGDPACEGAPDCDGTCGYCIAVTSFETERVKA